MRRVRLKEFGTFYSGLSGKSKSDFSEGNALLVTYRNIFNNPVLNPAIKDTVVVGKDEKQNEVLWGDILITGSSETPADAGMSSVVLFNPQEKMYLNSFCFGFRLNDMNEALPSYIGHLLRSTSIRAAISKTAFGVTRFNVNRMRFADIEIPLPPLNIQKEIVSILDSFTSLIDKMKQEVEMRKKQMEYYLNILICKDNVAARLFGDIGVVQRGKRVVRKELALQGCIPVFQNSLTPLGYYQYSNIPANNTFVISAGTAGEIGFSAKPFWAADDCLVISSVLCDSKYLYYYLKTQEQFLKSQIRGGAMKRLSRETIEKLEIPVPSLEKQRQIASILDTFETYISKLEKMIELRQKQYEYYREKLLTFE